MVKKIIIVIVILILIGTILLFLFSQRQSPVTNNQLPVANQPVTNNQLPVINQSKELTPAEKKELEHQELMVQARNFIERYGSFSTDANFTNLYELKDEMTNRFWQETEKSFDKAQDNTFYSISTKVLNITEKNFSDNLATYSVSTQRKETKNQVEKILYQNAEIKMLKQSGNWLIDSVSWK